MTNPILVGGGFVLVAGLIYALSIAVARRERARAERDRIDAEAKAKARADGILADPLSRGDVVDRLRDGRF
jgi:hypothetical protein